MVQHPNSYFMDVKCPGCYKITTVFSHAQGVVVCAGCSTILCQPTGGRAKLTEGRFHKKHVKMIKYIYTWTRSDEQYAHPFCIYSNNLLIFPKFQVARSDGSPIKSFDCNKMLKKKIRGTPSSATTVWNNIYWKQTHCFQPYT